MNTMHFGNILKELREKSGISQKQLVDKIGASKSSVSLYELNQRLPSLEVLAETARVFHVSTDYLLGIDKKKRIDVSDLSEKEVEIVENLVNLLIENKKK